MKYVIIADVSPEVGARLEANPAEIEGLLGKWQAHNPIGMYASLAKRRLLIILDAVNEDAFFEALHATWVAFESYPEVWPVVGMEEFGAIMQRVGITG